MPPSHAAPASAALADAQDLGAVDGATPIEGARLVLKRPAALQAAFDTLLQAQQDPKSSLFHHWVSAAVIGSTFGPSASDVGKAADWLRAQGFSGVSIAPSRMSIAFNGTATTVAAAFATPIHAYMLGARRVVGAASVPAIPASLGGIVDGVAAIDGFRPLPLVMGARPVERRADGSWHSATGAAATQAASAGQSIGGASPQLTTTVSGAQQEDVAPADFATIYDIGKLRSGTTTTLGTGETVAVVEDTDIETADWNTFRSAFGLSGYAATLTTLHPGCSDPGRTPDEVEAALDAEWATAVAPAAAVEIASCSNATGGIQGALQGLVSLAKPPPVISVSYGECESELGASGTNSWAELVEEGAAEGVSIFVSTGDSGSAGCDQGGTIAKGGLSVNGLASSGYDVAVGGTDFSDLASNTVSTYWNTTNTATYGSAKSYVPELPWNDTCANPTLATYEGSATTLAFCNTSAGRNFLAPGGDGGGKSTIFAKPSFQATSITGVPNDGKRDLPDVSLFASNGLWGHALVFCMSDTSEGGTACSYKTGTAVEMSSAGGTSFAAPAFAGIQALIDQKKGAGQGNPASRLYTLAGTQFSGSTASSCVASKGSAIGASCIFHDVTTSGNDQACKSGSTNCYTGGRSYGVLSTSTTSEVDGYSSTTGYDSATGLGSVDVANLVAAY